MKKLLVASTALVAATAFAGAAQAADPIKLSLGGFGYGAVTYYDNDDDYMRNNLQATMLEPEQNSLVVDGDNEVHFKGSTTLDNGLTVAVKYEVRTGGNGVGGTASDEWSITTSGGFGTVILGADDAATEAVAIMAPHMGGRLLGAGLSEGNMISGSYIRNPGIRVQNATFINSNDEELISYISPEIAGFTFGASYVPGLTAGQDAYGAVMSGVGLGAGADLYGVGALWAGEFSGVGVKASAGWATADLPQPADSFSQWQAGLGFDYAGFTLSGGYTKANVDDNTVGVADPDSSAWEVGVGYKTGPYGVALSYFSSNVDASTSTANAVVGGATGANDDEADIWQLTTQYTMGPGVMLVGGLAHVDFDGGEVGTADQNSGMVVQTGIMLSF